MDDPEPRQGGWLAAVAVILRPGDRGFETLMIERAVAQEDPWSGHMAFPGGRRDDVDGSLLETAVRETREETAIGLDKCGETLGRLQVVEPESVRLPVLSILPLVFRVPAMTSAQVASSEVARVLWVPLGHFSEPDVQAVYRQPVENRVLSFPAYQVGGGQVWGLTRRILHDLLDRIP